MTALPLISNENLDSDDTPLPLIVAKRWNFPLAHIQTDDGMYYAIQDWMRGVLGGHVTQLLVHIRRQRPQFNALIKMFPYKSTDGKTYQRPYITEDGLMSILVNARLRRGRSHLADIRNFVASFSSEYEYLKCFVVPNQRFTEREFQTELVAGLRPLAKDSKLREYFVTPSGRKIDIVLIKKYTWNPEPSAPKVRQVHMLIECKIDKKDFYKAIGQMTCYKAELILKSLGIYRMTLALAMPDELIDDYMREIAARISFKLISIIDGIVIDENTERPLELDT